MGLAPITEEDKPALESIIKRLKRMRKREVAQMQRNYGTPQLDTAIEELMEYGSYKGWWEHDGFKG